MINGYRDSERPNKGLSNSWLKLCSEVELNQRLHASLIALLVATY